MKLNFLNLKNGQLSQNSYRNVEASLTTIEDLLNSANGSNECLTASFDEVNRNAGSATTVYWFDYEGSKYGLVVSDDGEKDIVDIDGCPVDDLLISSIHTLLEI